MEEFRIEWETIREKNAAALQKFQHSPADPPAKWRRTADDLDQCAGA